MLALDDRAEKRLTITNTRPVALMTFPIGMSLLGGADATHLPERYDNCNSNTAVYKASFGPNCLYHWSHTMRNYYQIKTVVRLNIGNGSRDSRAEQNSAVAAMADTAPISKKLI